MELKTLQNSLRDWTDWDFAGFSLGICLGLWPPAPDFGNAKHVSWSVHTLGDLLHDMRDSLTRAGVLERRKEPDIQYRWNPAFVGSWDSPSTEPVDTS